MLKSVPKKNAREATMKATTDGHQEVVTELYARYGKVLKSVVEQVVKEEEQVDDLVQAVFLNLYREAVRETFYQRTGT